MKVLSLEKVLYAISETTFAYESLLQIQERISIHQELPTDFGCPLKLIRCFLPEARRATPHRACEHGAD